MNDFLDQFAKFKLNEELKSKFVDFETIWQTKENVENSYRIITVINNDISVSELESQEENNAELA